MRRVKHLLTYVLVLSMCFTLFFMPKYTVYADTATYAVMEANICYIWTTKFTADGNLRRNSVLTTSENARFVWLSNFTQNGNTQNRGVYIVWKQSSRPSGYWQDNGSASACGTVSTLNYPRAFTYNGEMYWQIGLYGNDTNSYGGNSIEGVTLNLNTSLSNDLNTDLVYYTWGDGAIEPAPPGPTYGRVADVEYSTRIVGSGLASADNIDRIVWNQSVDTNGNDLPTGARVQIRAIPGKYVGNTASDVLNKTYVDFILDHSKQLIIVDIIASRGVYETKWSEVVDHFGFFPYSWVPNIQYLDNEYFKMGWIYQIRLQVDDYYSDWQNIYTATGSGASESQTITDSDELTQQLVQDINIVNQLNNTTTTNWYINETTINNSEYTENTNGKPWWAYLLEAILSLFQIDDGNQQTINNTNNLNIDLNDKLDEYNQIEDQQLQNLDTNLDAIEVESDMLENNKFIGSANWVATQYNRMTNGTVIGSLIGFSLLFGLALIFIGKIR